jgi:hypothetical protein
MPVPEELTSADTSSRVQTNVISTLLLSALVLPLLKKTSMLPAPSEGVELRPHLVIVSSGGTSISSQRLTCLTHGLF